LKKRIGDVVSSLFIALERLQKEGCYVTLQEEEEAVVLRLRAIQSLPFALEF